MTPGRVIVVGAGAAGLLAAGQAASLGASVLLLEKMDRPGRKLLLTGKGRCNLTNADPLPEFIEHFGPNGRFLRQAFARFFSADLLDFFSAMGIASAKERGGRYFLSSGRADQAVQTLVEWATQQGAILQTRSAVESLLIEDGRVVGVQISAANPAAGAARSALSRRLPAQAVILTTGGASYPHTGSSGDGYRLAQAAGHDIIPVRPALVPLVTCGSTARKLQGLSLRNVGLRVILDERTQLAEGFGEMLFTHFGLSGPVVLSLSKQVVDALHSGRRVHISIDLKPALSQEKLDARLLREVEIHSKRQVHTMLKELLPAKLIPVCLELTGLPGDKPVHQLTALERRSLRLWLKDFRLEVRGHRSFAQAIITAGGVDLRQVDPRSMESRLVRGLYFAGELLDLGADTGGYNLQAAFSTGWLAGRSAALACTAQDKAA